jgi:hypothetical protein
MYAVACPTIAKPAAAWYVIFLAGDFFPVGAKPPAKE